MEKIIVMGGRGKIGSALVSIFEEAGYHVDILEKYCSRREPVAGCHYKFLHVAIPFSGKFVREVRRAISLYFPTFVVIHSTVPVGTTRKIGMRAVHSPVRGQHTDLVGGIRKFEKYVAGTSRRVVKAVEGHFLRSGITVKVWSKPEETELMKLLCLSRLLNDLAMYEKAFQICKRFHVSPARFIQWTGSYNDGYRGTRFVRPDLLFPFGVAGGTCVKPVSRMLFNQDGDEWLGKNLQVFGG